MTCFGKPKKKQWAYLRKRGGQRDSETVRDEGTERRRDGERQRERQRKTQADRDKQRKTDGGSTTRGTI